MAWKQMVCLILIIQTIINVAVTKKIPNSRSSSTTTSAPETTVDTEYYIDEAVSETPANLNEKLTTKYEKTKTMKSSLEKKIISGIYTTKHSTFGITTQSSRKEVPTNMINKVTIKPKSFTTTKKTSLGSMNSHVKNMMQNKSPSISSNKDDYEYEEDGNEQIILTTPFQTPNTNKYLSARGTSTVTPLTKSRQNTKLQSQISSTSSSADNSVDVLMTGSNALVKTIPSKKSSELSQADQTLMENYKPESSSMMMNKKVTKAIPNTMSSNQESSSSDSYYYYEDDDAATSPTTTTKKQNDETSRTIFKPIGSHITSSKSSIRMSLPTTKLPVTTSHSIDNDYYYQDNSLDNTESIKLPKKTILFPQAKDNVDDKHISTKTLTTQKSVTLPSSSISWHGNPKITPSSHSTVKKPDISSQDDYLTDINLENESKTYPNVENDEKAFGLPQISFPGHQTPVAPFQPIQISGPRVPQVGPGFQQNLKLGQVYSDNSNTGKFNGVASNSPGFSNSIRGQIPSFEQDSSMIRNNGQIIRASPFDDDYSDNLSTEIPVSTSTDKSLKKKNSQLDEKHQTEKKVKQIFPDSKSAQSKDINLDKMNQLNSNKKFDSSLQQESTVSSTFHHKGSTNPLMTTQDNKNAHLTESPSKERDNYNPAFSKSPGKNDKKIQGENSGADLRPDSLPLCRTKSGYLKRYAYVLNCKNDTVQLQSAYQPWNSQDSAFKITLCSSDASSHDKRIIAVHPELKDSVTNFQCLKAKGTCIQKYTELVVMVHTETAAKWDCVKIPYGCTCDLPQQ